MYFGDMFAADDGLTGVFVKGEREAAIVELPPQGAWPSLYSCCLSPQPSVFVSFSCKDVG